MTSEMASLDISIPPSTHCSAARSCGGVRSNSPPRGASSATLIRPTSPPRGCPVEPPLPRSTYVLHDGCDSLLRPADLVQSRCAQACGQPVQTRRPPCARAGEGVEDKAKRWAHGALTACGDAVHRVCEEKTLQGYAVHTRRNPCPQVKRRGEPGEARSPGRVPGRQGNRRGALGRVDQGVQRAARVACGKGRFRWAESITIMTLPA